MPAPDLSIVIVSYNTRDLLDRCLDAIPAAASGLAVEVIVVDNGSSDGTLERIALRHPEVLLQSAGGNLGFAHATNLGIARCSGRVLVWLNPDTVPAPGSLARLVAYLDAHPQVGAVGPLVRFPDGDIQPSAQAFPGPVQVLFKVLGVRRWASLPLVGALARRAGRAASATARSYFEALDPQAAPRSVDWISGVCLATPAAVAGEVGPLDERYFMYCEDVDWCHRIHETGREVHQVADATIEHVVGASGGESAFVTFQYYRSLLRYFTERRPRAFRLVRPLVLAAFLARALGRVLVRPFTGPTQHAWWRLASLYLAGPDSGEGLT